MKDQFRIQRYELQLFYIRHFSVFLIMYAIALVAYVHFMHASIEDGKFILYGVTDAPALIEQALEIARTELPQYEAVSSVSIVQDFKQFQ